jgi:hypothetical protein
MRFGCQRGSLSRVRAPWASGNSDSHSPRAKPPTADVLTVCRKLAARQHRHRFSVQSSPSPANKRPSWAARHDWPTFLTASKCLVGLVLAVRIKLACGLGRTPGSTGQAGTHLRASDGQAEGVLLLSLRRYHPRHPCGYRDLEPALG